MVETDRWIIYKNNKDAQPARYNRCTGSWLLLVSSWQDGNGEQQNVIWLLHICTFGCTAVVGVKLGYNRLTSHQIQKTYSWLDTQVFGHLAGHKSTAGHYRHKAG